MKKKNKESLNPKSKSRFNIGDYFVQTILIIIGVLLAFMLNEFRENLRENQVRDMALQEEYFLNSIEKLADLFFQREILDASLLHENLVLMHRLTGEIIGQEQTIVMQYRSTLEIIQN